MRNFFRPKRINNDILMCGMQGSGKRSILSVNELGFSESDIETSNLKYKGFNICCTDIDHNVADRTRKGSKHYAALIYVVDAKDRVKLGNINILVLFSGWIRKEFEQITKCMVPEDVIGLCYDYFNPDLCPLIGHQRTAFDYLESLEVGETVCRNRIRPTAPVLIFGTKCDLKGHMDAAEITKKLNMNSFERTWKVQMVSSRDDRGIIDGFNWIVKTTSMVGAKYITE